MLKETTYDKLQTALEKSMDANEKGFLSSLLNDMSKVLSDEELFQKLHLFHSIRFLNLKTTDFFSSYPSQLPNVPFLSLSGAMNPDTPAPLLHYYPGIFALLNETQLELARVYDTRMRHQYLSTTVYDKNLIKTSPIFEAYMKTSRRADYLQGSLTLDLPRGVKFVGTDGGVTDILREIHRLERQVENYSKLVAETDKDIGETEYEIVTLKNLLLNSASLPESEKLDQRELANIRERIPELYSFIKVSKQENDAYRSYMEQAARLIKNPYIFITNFVGDEKKADVLNRFGHQMILAEFMREFARIFYSPTKPKLEVSLLTDNPDKRVHNIVKDDKGHFYVEVKLGFDSLVRGDGFYGALAANRRDLEWSRDANIIKQNRGEVVELKGRVRLLPDPDHPKEFVMAVESFQVTSHTPNLVPKPELIPRKNIKLEEDRAVLMVVKPGTPPQL